MPLSSVIIADDDYLVIEDLKKSIQWEELGYFVASTATNGSDALKLVNRHRPDLLITDIIMPSMTGLELIEKVRNLYPDMQILIISSYDEFEYAKTAIAHGVADYILKTQITPMSFSQRLIELAHSAVNKKKRNQAAMRQRLQDYFSHRSMETLSSENDPILRSVSAFKYIFITVGIHAPFTANHESFDRIMRESVSAADDTITAKFTDISIPVRFIYGQFLILGFVATQDMLQNNSVIRSVAAKLHGILETATLHSVEIYVSTAPQTIGSFRTTFFESLPIMMFRSAFCNGSILSIDELSLCRYVPVERDFPFRGFGHRPEERNSGSDLLMEHVQKCIDGYDINGLYHLYWLLTAWNSSDSNTDQKNDDGLYFSEPEVFMSHVRSLILDRGTSSENEGIQSMPIVVKKAVEYIRENFGNHDISVQSISDAVSVSSGRLGVLFRQCLGKSINEYLTDVRIERAIYLLQNTSLKIYEVADQSGFNAPHYFSDIMYKKTGKRPIDYKRLPQ